MQHNTKKEETEKNEWETVHGKPRAEKYCSPDREKYIYDREIKYPVRMKTRTDTSKNILIFAHYTSSKFIFGLVLEACTRKV
jgi:hypothetical protein